MATVSWPCHPGVFIKCGTPVGFVTFVALWTNACDERASVVQNLTESKVAWVLRSLGTLTEPTKHSTRMAFRDHDEVEIHNERRFVLR